MTATASRHLVKMPQHARKGPPESPSSGDVVVVEAMRGPQAEFVRSEAAYPAYIAGRRGGKTSASVMKMVKYVTEHPGAYGMFTVPTMGDIDRILLPKMNEFFGRVHGRLWAWREKKSEFVFPPYGATVFIRPASEPDSCRGPTLAFAAMDEVGTEDQEAAFHILEPALSQPGYPHQLWVTSTPNVERPWIKRLWQEKINPVDGEPVEDPADYPLFRARTIDNWHLEESVRARLLASWRQSRMREQELEGEFISVEGLAFEVLDAGLHLRWPREDEVWAVQGVAGLDIGGTSPTALVEWKRDLSGRFWATGEFYKRDADEYDWVEWCRERNIMRIICDPSVSEKQLKAWRQHYRLNISLGSSLIRTWKGRKNIWKTGLEPRVVGGTRLPGIFISPECPNLWSELGKLAAYKPRGHGEFIDEWRPGSSDHAYDAGAYGLSYFEKQRGSPPRSKLKYKGW